MNILVTGSDGFVAKNLIINLKNLKYKIIKFDRQNNFQQLEKKIIKSDIIFHLAEKIDLITTEIFSKIT